MTLKNIYCPKCIESDGLIVSLNSLLCPQCRTQYTILRDGLMPEGNGTYSFTTCKKCGGRYVHYSYMVNDGGDDVDWDGDEWCENPECETNKIDTQTEYGVIKKPSKIDNKESTIL